MDAYDAKLGFIYDFLGNFKLTILVAVPKRNCLGLSTDVVSTFPKFLNWYTHKREILWLCSICLLCSNEQPEEIILGSHYRYKIVPQF